MERDNSMNLSRSGSLRSSSRTTLIRRNQSMSAKQIRFYRNGDRFFNGLKLAVSPERYKELDALLAELSTKLDLSSGAVRFIFNGEDGSMITDISQLHYGVPYVCSSTNTFKQLEVGYGKTSPQWALAQRNSRSTHTLTGLENILTPNKEVSSMGSRDFIKPKLVTVIRNGKPPQKKVTMLLNNKTAISLDQVLDHLSAKGSLGKVDKLYSVDRKLVKDLRDLFDDDTVFIAFASTEKFPEEGVELDPNTYRITPYRELKRPSNLKRSNSLRTPRKHRDENENMHGRGGKPARPKSMGPGIKMQVSAKSPRPKSAAGKKMNGDVAKEELYPTAVFERESSDSDSMRSEYEFDPDVIRMNSKRERLSIHGFYKVGKIIGDGNFAVVRQCKNRQTGKEYALKVINKAKVKGKEHMIENEILILRRVKHPHIVELVEEFETPKEIFLIMELIRGGDLFDAIVQATRFTERDASHMIRDLASAVHHLHALHIVHRDIKPENLLVVHKPNGTMSLKLADFGLSIEVQSPMFLVCGTPTYVAPEILDESGYGLKVDIWAIGVISYILLCGFPPFRSESNDQEELFDKIMRGDYEYLSPFWDDISHSAKDLINHVLVVDVDKRYTAQNVLDHPWIKGHTAASKNIQRKLSNELTKNFQHRKRLRGVAMAIQTVIALLKYVRQKRNASGKGMGGSFLGAFATPLSPKRALALASKIPRVRATTPRHHIEEIRKGMSAHVKKCNTYSLCSTKAVTRSVSRANSGEYEVAEMGRYSVIGNVYRRVHREGKLNGLDKRPTLDAQLGRQTVSSQRLSSKTRPILHKHSCSAHYLSYYETPSMVVGETMRNQAKPRRPCQQTSTTKHSAGCKVNESRRVMTPRSARGADGKSSLTVKGVKPSYIPIRSAPSSPKRGSSGSRTTSASSIYGSVSLPNTPGVENASAPLAFMYSPANSSTSVKVQSSRRIVREERKNGEKKFVPSQGRARISSASEAMRKYSESSTESRGTGSSSGTTSRRISCSGSVSSRRSSTACSGNLSRASSMRDGAPESKPTSRSVPSKVTISDPKAKTSKPSSTSKPSRPNALNLVNCTTPKCPKASKDAALKLSNPNCKNVPSLDTKKKSRKMSADSNGNISITTKTSKTENIKIRLGKTVNKLVETETSTTVSVTIENDAKVNNAEDSRTTCKEPSLGQTLLSKVKRLAEEIESLAKFDGDKSKSKEENSSTEEPCTFHAEERKNTEWQAIPRCKSSSDPPHEEQKPLCAQQTVSTPGIARTELCSTKEVISCPSTSATRKKTSISSHSKSFEEEELDLDGIDDIVYRNFDHLQTGHSPAAECNQDSFGPTEYLSLTSKQDKSLL